jgi:formylglycine-generating enzyme required for sulfatase activity
MPKNTRPQTHPDTSDVSVKLKRILGIAPGVYLTAIYGLVVALLVFFLLFYPGIRNRGAYLTVSVRPGSASVRVDGRFAGTAPGTVFVANGVHSVEVAKPYFASAVSPLKVRGRVFATLLVPSRMRLSAELTASDVPGLLRHALADFAVNPHIPQIISEASWAAYGTRNSSEAAADQALLYGFIRDAMYSVSSEAQVREVLLASARTAADGTFLTPQGLLAMARESAEFATEHSNAAAWMLLSLSREHARTLSSSAWITRHFAAYREALSRYYSGTPATAGADGGGALSFLGGIRFRSIPAGFAIIGKDDNLDALGRSIDALLAHPVSVGAFLLSETEVTNRQFKAFLESSPEWRPSARDSLVEKGLATEGYLADWTSDTYPSGQDELPVCGVSFFAAQAYCQWLAQRTGAAVRLPTEAEWEWAARGGLRGMPYPLGERPGRAVLFTKGISGPSAAGTSEPNGYGLRDMVGNVWEWCSDSFGAADYLLSSQDPRTNAELVRSHPAAGDKVVRGGAWNSQRELVRLYTRGSQPADWCTPFLGFRVAIGRP